MWKTVLISRGERLTLTENRLAVEQDGRVIHIPLDDIYSVVVDNRQTMLSVGVMTALTTAGAHIVLCDEKHLPVSVILPENCHYRPYATLKSQLGMPEELKAALWQKVVSMKVSNQCRALRFCGVPPARYEDLTDMPALVLPGDERNIEATAARKYFAALFGPVFRRSDDDITNAAMNYGYAIMRTAVAKTLAAYGYNAALGIHHCNEGNAFNLADDLMEPLRPVVDYWVDTHIDELFDELTQQNRRDLVQLVNAAAFINGKRMRIRYAIDCCVSSLTTAIKTNNAEALLLPELMRAGTIAEDEEGD